MNEPFQDEENKEGSDDENEGGPRNERDQPPRNDRRAKNTSGNPRVYPTLPKRGTTFQ